MLNLRRGWGPRILRSRNQITEEIGLKLGKGKLLLKWVNRVGKERRARYCGWIMRGRPELREEWRWCRTRSEIWIWITDTNLQNIKLKSDSPWVHWSNLNFWILNARHILLPYLSLLHLPQAQAEKTPHLGLHYIFWNNESSPECLMSTRPQSGHWYQEINKE